MPLYSKASLELLRQKIDLVEVLSSHLSMKRSGSAYKAICPFHEEKSPSFFVQRGDSYYHCFGCGAHGDAIQFLMQFLKMNFMDAVQYLAERFGVILETQEREKRDPNAISKQRMKEAGEVACSLYEYFLLHMQEAEPVLKYLYDRALGHDFITSFRLGYAPKDEELFLTFMRKQGFSQQELVQSGLCSIRGQQLRPLFSERVVFPIQDIQGSVIGFSARKMREETFGGKYINTPETEIFKKSKLLFGLYYSRRRIVKDKQAIVVEGQIDALRLIFSGFDYTVAALGTAFGEAHVRELKQLGIVRVYLLFDGDEAGRRASIKVGHLFQKQGIEVLIAALAPKSDPDLILANEGPVSVMNLLLKSRDYLAFLVDEESKSFDLSSPAEKNRLVRHVMQQIQEWEDPVLIHESIKKVAQLVQLPHNLLQKHLTDPLKQETSTSLSRSAEKEVEFDPNRILETDVLRWLILCAESDPVMQWLYRANIAPHDFQLPLSRKVYEVLLKRLEEKQPLDILEIAGQIEEEEFGPFLSIILNKRINREKKEQLAQETIKRFKERNWLLQREEVKMKIHSAALSDEELMLLVRRFDELKSKPPQLVLPKEDVTCKNKA